MERKHRNILEMARALRFQADFPLQFWGDCVQATILITNRLPIPILNHKTPFEALHHKKPAYNHLKAFGCLVARNPAITKDKFTIRGVPCIFIGYPRTQKGYKLYNLLTHSHFVSMDVKSYVNIYPYHEFHSVSSQKIKSIQPHN